MRPLIPRSESTDAKTSLFSPMIHGAPSGPTATARALPVAGFQTPSRLSSQNSSSSAVVAYTVPSGPTDMVVASMPG